jgi:hypothetical protein
LSKHQIQYQLLNASCELRKNLADFVKNCVKKDDQDRFPTELKVPKC